MAMTDANLTLEEAHEFLDINGVRWSFGWFKSKVHLGAIPSHKEYMTPGRPKSGVRLIKRTDLEIIIRDYKMKRAVA